MNADRGGSTSSLPHPALAWSRADGQRHRHDERGTIRSAAPPSMSRRTVGVLLAGERLAPGMTALRTATRMGRHPAAGWPHPLPPVGAGAGGGRGWRWRTGRCCRCSARTTAGSSVEAGCGAGTRYRYRLADGLFVPDPASRCQPEDVHGPSVVVDPRAYAWRQPGWMGRPWRETVLYELHAGAMGGFAGVLRGTAAAAAPRHHRGGADAGQRFPRPAQLGLRRRAALCAGQRLWLARRTEGAGRPRARARADDVPRRGVQPLRPGRELPAQLRPAVLPRGPSRRPGVRRSTSAARRCARSSPATCCTG